MKKNLLIKRNNSYICLLLFFLFSPPLPLFAQQKKLDVDGELRIHSPDSGLENGKIRNGMALAPRATMPTGSCTSGTLVYCLQDKRLYGCLASAWQPLGSGGATTDRSESTIIVAAHDSFGSNNNGSDCSAGGACANPRADYTCDGTDDQFVINQALHDLPDTGGTVYLLEGTYNVSGNAVGGYGPGIRLYYSDRAYNNNITLTGSGRSTVLKIAGTITSGVHAVTIPTHLGLVQNMVISNLVIDGNNKIGSSNIGIALWGSSGIKNIKIDRAWVRNIDGDGIYILANVENISITDSFIQNNAGYGIYSLCSLSTDTNFRTYITGNTIENNGKAGVRIWGTGNSENFILRNNILNNGQSGIAFNQVTYGTIQGNNIRGNGTSSICGDINDGCHGIYMQNMNAPGYRSVNYTTENTLICENNINANKGNGIKLANFVYHILISRNNIVGNQQQGVYLYNSKYNFITGCMIKDNGTGASNRRGIEAGFACTENHFSGNRISYSAGIGDFYGIYINDNGSGPPNNYFYANKIDKTSAYYNSREIYNFIDTMETQNWLQHGALFTDKWGLGLQERPSVGGMSPAIDGISYKQVWTDTSSINMGSGVAPGDIAILEIYDDAVWIYNYGSISIPWSTEFYKEDVLMLMWNGEKWNLIGASRNSY